MFQRLHEILNECSWQFRKGQVVTQTESGAMMVTTIDAMPHESEIDPNMHETDCILVTIGVDKALVDKHKKELVEILDNWPSDLLKQGPSYITLGGEIGSQGAAFQLFAVGEYLGLWKVITPKVLGVPDDLARVAAGNGFVMCTGYPSSYK